MTKNRKIDKLQQNGAKIDRKQKNRQIVAKMAAKTGQKIEKQTNYGNNGNNGGKNRPKVEKIDKLWQKWRQKNQRKATKSENR